MSSIYKNNQENFFHQNEKHGDLINYIRTSTTPNMQSRESSDLIEGNGDHLRPFPHVPIHGPHLLQQSLGVLLLEAEKSQALPSANTGNEHELLRGVAEGVNGHPGEPLLHGLRRHGEVEPPDAAASG